MTESASVVNSSIENKQYIADFSRTASNCCVNCIHFMVGTAADEPKHDDGWYHEPKCAHGQCHNQFERWSQQYVMTKLHEQDIMEMDKSKFLWNAMWPAPDTWVSDVPDVLSSRERVNTFLQTLHLEPLPDGDGHDDLLDPQLQICLFMAVGRIGKRLLLEQAITKEEYYDNEPVVKAWSDSLARQRSERAMKFGDMNYFIERQFEDVVCSYFQGHNTHPDVKTILAEIRDELGYCRVATGR